MSIRLFAHCRPVAFAYGLLFSGLLAGNAVTATAQTGDDLLSDREVQAFITEMVARHGMGREGLTKLIGQSRVLQHVLDAFARPAESKPWYEYRPIFLTPTRIAGGVEFWKGYRKVLERAEATFGVPAEIIVAIIGVETNYGRRKGSIRVVDALVTLAFRYPKRGAFFRRELEQFLLLVREERLEPRKLTGSYAGAMGVPQFIPSSYRAYAVDFDGDQVRDLLTSVPDAIGSVGNYLERHGWRTRGAVAVPAAVVGEEAGKIVALGLEPKVRLDEMRGMGVTVEAHLPGALRGALVALETRNGPEYWVGLQNFYTITRYNHSPLYAMAVYQLATAILTEYAGRSDG